jgi:hypothetical protein
MAGENLAFEFFFSSSVADDTKLTTALAIEAAAANASIWTAMHPMQVQRVGVLVTVTINYNVVSTLAVIAFYRRVLYGDDTGRVEMGRVTIPDGTKAGTVIYLDIPNGQDNDNGEVIAGGQVVSAVAVAGTGGGAIAGDFMPWISWVPMSLQPANNKDSAGVVTLIQDVTTVQV